MDVAERWRAALGSVRAGAVMEIGLPLLGKVERAGERATAC